MEHPFGRTLRVFFVLVAAAGFYRLTVVPLVEPRNHAVSVALEPTPEEAAAIRARTQGSMEAVGGIFPAGSWERDEPIVLENRRMRLLFKQYHNMPDGRVNLVPCTLVILPEPEGKESGDGRTIVMRAPQGAMLQFSEPFDLRQGRLSKFSLVGGTLRGQITIRGSATAEGAEDDFEIITRDVEMAGNEVRSNEPVQFRHGRSSGSGRALLVKLLSKPGKGDEGPGIAGIDVVRLERDVQLRLDGLGGGLLPGSQPRPDAAESPATVTCRGGLTVHMTANLITLEDHVDVVRPFPDGGTDQLACDLLSISMAKKEKGGLEAKEIEARGRPVIARSTAAGLEARAARLGYEIATRRILLDGELPVSLAAREVDMEARSIDYVPGPPGDPGSLMAVGPGWLTTKASDGSPPATVRYRKWLRVRRHGDGHVASVSGDAEVSVESQGRLAASEIHLWLELAKAGDRAAAAKPAASGTPDLSGVRPSRMLASGMVQVEADQLAARVERMEVWFRHPAAAPPVAATPPATRAAPAAAAAAAPAVTGPPKPAAAEQPADPPRGRILASGALLRGQVVMAPGGQQVEDMSLEGQVHLVEEPIARNGVAVDPAEKPLEIRGDQLQLSRPMRFDARAVVAGRPATISGRGADLEGPLVTFDRGRNRMTVDGAGRLMIPVQPGTVGLDALAVSTAPRAADGPPQGAAAERLAVAWRGSMNFDGLTARFVDQVVATSGGASLNSGSLDVVFDRKFDFGGASDPRAAGRPEVARIACGSGVRLESTSTTDDGSRSVEKLALLDMVVDRATGDFSGNGPGRLSSTRFGQPPGGLSEGGLPGAGGPGAPPKQPVARPDELTYLGVTFQRGMRGNLNRRVMEFHQRVEAIWGPVASWESTLDVHSPGGLPARAVAVSSDLLAVGQTPIPVGRRNAIELQASGNVLVEGDTFTARSGRLSWSEAKDLLVFEGDGRSGAQLFRQMHVGAPTSTASAGRILYWRGLNRVQTDDVRYLDFDQLGGPSAGLAIPGMGGPARK